MWRLVMMSQPQSYGVQSPLCSRKLRGEHNADAHVLPLAAE